MVKTQIVINIIYVSALFGQAVNTWTVGTTARDYSTIQACETAKNDDQKGNNEVDKCECYNDSEFDESVTITQSAGSNSPTQNFWITVASADRHSGVHGGTRLTRTGAPNANVIGISDDHVVVEWLDIHNWTTDATKDKIAIGLATGADSCIFRYLIVHDGDAVGGGDDGIGTTAGGGAGSEPFLAHDNILYDIGGDGFAIPNTSLGFLKLYNNTVYNCGEDGFDNGAKARGKLRNNISVGNVASDFLFSGAPDWDYNLDSDNTDPGVNSVNNSSATNNFTNITGGSEDLHLKTSADAIGAGIGPGSDSDVPTEDIDGDTRSGATTDIGADLFVSAEAPTTGIRKFVPPIYWNKKGGFNEKYGLWHHLDRHACLR